MEFVARLLHKDIDQAMLLFQLRRAGATATFEAPAKGGSDLQILGTVADEKLPNVLEALGQMPGALHAGDLHYTLGKGAQSAETIQAAEAHLPGPFTVVGTTRNHWSFGGDDIDRVVQQLFLGGKQDVKTLHEKTELRVELVMRALQDLSQKQTVRKYRVEGGAEQYDLAGTVRAKLDGRAAPIEEEPDY